MALKKRESFVVIVKNWEKHNSKKKKGHTHIMLSTRFFDDVKIQKLCGSAREAYIWLLLRCGDEASNRVESTPEALMKSIGSPRVHYTKLLYQLQENQLVSIEKLDANIKEEKVQEKKLREVAPRSKTQTSDAPPLEPIQAALSDVPEKPKSNPEANRRAWEAYKAAYLERYKIEPLRDLKANCAIASIVKRVGAEDAPEILKFYVRHSDSFYLKTTHSIGIALRDVESLRTQWMKGTALTSKDVRDYERTVSYQDQMDKVMRGVI